MTKQELLALAENSLLMEVGRLAIEETLIWMRDDHIFMLRNNGFTIKEKDGTPSSIIRMGPEQGLRIALKAIAEKLEDGNGNNQTSSQAHQ